MCMCVCICACVCVRVFSPFYMLLTVMVWLYICIVFDEVHTVCVHAAFISNISVSHTHTHTRTHTHTHTHTQCACARSGGHTSNGHTTAVRHNNSTEGELTTDVTVVSIDIA